jgi:hypothetical protein
MSVALLVEQVDGEAADKYIPVATERFFLDYWLSVIKKLNLTWLSLIQPGLPITEEDLPAVLVELHVLQQQLPAFYAAQSEEFGYMNQRLSMLLAELEALQGKQVALYLG